MDKLKANAKSHYDESRGEVRVYITDAKRVYL